MDELIKVLWALAYICLGGAIAFAVTAYVLARLGQASNWPRLGAAGSAAGFVVFAIAAKLLEQ